jgi:hypothetical protein
MGGDFEPKSEWLRDNRVGVFDQTVTGDRVIKLGALLFAAGEDEIQRNNQEIRESGKEREE